MPRFFIEAVLGGYRLGDHVAVTGGDARHILKSLRLQAGEQLTLCDGQGNDYLCVLEESASEEKAFCRVLACTPTTSEPDVKVTLYQALPKGDKMELIIQKSVELGVSRIVPIMTRRCVSRPDAQALAKKLVRWNKIAAEAAMQSRRGCLPQVGDLLSFEQMLEQVGCVQRRWLLYEVGGVPLASVMPAKADQIAVVVGSEGGFEPSEAEAARKAGMQLVHLGDRILRCETAPLCVLSAVMYATGNL